MDFPIMPMPPDLWPAVREIYREGIGTGNATFETEIPELGRNGTAIIARIAGWLRSSRLRKIVNL